LDTNGIIRDDDMKMTKSPRTKKFNQKNLIDINYTEYIKYLTSLGYNREQLNIDESSEIVSIKSLAKGTTGNIIDIRCPSRYKIIIAGRNQLPEEAHPPDLFSAKAKSLNQLELISTDHKLAIRFADRENVEIYPDTRIRILKEKVSNAITVVGTMFYKDLTATQYLKTPPNDTKPYENFYRFNENIEINGEEHLKIDVVNPDIGIDAKNVKLSLDMDLWEGE
jgi:hypothetical protein